MMHEGGHGPYPGPFNGAMSGAGRWPHRAGPWPGHGDLTAGGPAHVSCGGGRAPSPGPRPGQPGATGSCAPPSPGQALGAPEDAVGSHGSGGTAASARDSSESSGSRPGDGPGACATGAATGRPLAQAQDSEDLDSGGSGAGDGLEPAVDGLGRRRDGRVPCTWPGCVATFSDPYGLRRHLRTHTGEKPYPCTFQGCDKSFGHKQSLEYHIAATHTQNRPHKCTAVPGCTLAFPTAAALRVHVRRHERDLSSARGGASGVAFTPGPGALPVGAASRVQVARRGHVQTVAGAGAGNASAPVLPMPAPLPAAVAGHPVVEPLRGVTVGGAAPAAGTASGTLPRATATGGAAAAASAGPGAADGDRDLKRQRHR